MSSPLQSMRVERPAGAHVAEVVLLGPGRGNALGPDFWNEAPGVFAALDADVELRAVIVRGEGAHFSYGLDLMGVAPEIGPLLDGGAGARGQIFELGRKMQRAFEVLSGLGKPVIAAVDGWCIGAGLELICACDLRLCTEAARFSLREVKMSMVSDLGGLQRLPFLVGEGHARELALTGGDTPAAHAARIGLVNSVSPDAAAMMIHARGLAAQLAANPPLAVTATKRVMNARLEASLAVGLREALMHNTSIMQSADFQEAMAAFLEKRPPSFKGK